jgi:hypothetical protein
MISELQADILDLQAQLAQANARLAAATRLIEAIADATEDDKICTIKVYDETRVEWLHRAAVMFLGWLGPVADAPARDVSKAS